MRLDMYDRSQMQVIYMLMVPEFIHPAILSGFIIEYCYQLRLGRQ
jgi:hypothetical protein